MKKQLKFSICMPAYNGGEVIGETIKSILSQSFKNYDFIIVNDDSSDNTAEVIKSFKDPRIKYFKNKKNLGYSKNLEVCRKKAKNPILFLMGQDDILAKETLQKVHDTFVNHPQIGALTRVYYWFDEDIKKPVRAKFPISKKHDSIVSVDDDPKKIVFMFRSLDQLSGLAYRRKWMDRGFHQDIFPCHVYPFASIFKKHPVYFMKDYTIAVRVGTSQSRSISGIYQISPLQSWVNMFNRVFQEKKFKELRKYMIKNFVANNYVGLVQIKNYSTMKFLLREIFLLVKHRKDNLFHPGFWFFSLGTIIIPRKILIPLVDSFKNRILSQALKEIKFEYSLGNG